MPVGLAAAVAGRLHAHQPGVLPVLHVADQLAVLDQHRAVGRRALVVDGERAAPLGDRAVIDHGDALGGNLLTHQAGEGRRLLAVEVALQSVADRLVQHHARPAGRQHDVECTGRRGYGLQIDQRLAQSLLCGVLPTVFDQELAKTLPAARAVGTGSPDGPRRRPRRRRSCAPAGARRAPGARRRARSRHAARTKPARRSPAARADPRRATRRRFPAAASPCPRRLAIRSDSPRRKDGGWCAAGASASVPEYPAFTAETASAARSRASCESSLECA